MAVGWHVLHNWREKGCIVFLPEICLDTERLNQSLRTPVFPRWAVLLQGCLRFFQMMSIRVQVNTDGAHNSSAWPTKEPHHWNLLAVSKGKCLAEASSPATSLGLPGKGGLWSLPQVHFTFSYDCNDVRVAVHSAVLLLVFSLCWDITDVSILALWLWREYVTVSVTIFSSWKSTLSSLLGKKSPQLPVW